MSGMRKVWMVGAGDLARELYGWISEDAAAEFEIAGFIDDREAIDLSPHGIGLPVLTPEEAGERLRGAEFIMGVSSPGSKRSLAGRLSAAGARPLTYVHSSVLVGRDVVIGAGSVISPRTVVCSHSRIGEWCTVNAFCEIGHEVRVNDFATLLGHNALNGRVEIGEECLVGCGALFHPGVRVGRGATVGIGSVVLSHVKPGVTVFGNPARKISSAA